MKSEPDYSAVVVKEHTLIDKMSKLSKIQEFRLIAYCLSHYDSRKPENRIFKASVRDLTAVFPTMDKKSAYGVVREAMISINKKPLEFKEGKKHIFRNWFTGFNYVQDAGIFEFMINPDLAPWLLNLKGTFTRYRLQDVYRFQSANTWKLYEQLKKCWEYQNTWVVKLEELKEKLGIPKKYPRWSSFKEWVIDPALNEINKYSDITVSYEVEKQVRTVTGIVFFVDGKQPEEVITLENPKESIYKALLACGVKECVASDYVNKVVSAGKLDHIARLIPTLKRRWEKHKSGPLAAYMLSAIKGEIESQQQLDEPKQSGKYPEYLEALNCWQDKRKAGKKCAVRERGKAGEREKCQKCLEKIKISDFGV